MFKRVTITISHKNISADEFNEIREKLSNWISDHQLQHGGTSTYHDLGHNLIVMLQEGKTTIYGTDPEYIISHTLLFNVDPKEYTDLLYEFKTMKKTYADNFDIRITQ